VKAKLEAIQCQLLRGDAGKVMTNAAAEGKKFDLILLDPPFGQGRLAKILPVCRDVRVTMVCVCRGRISARGAK
jgi:23S rRNA G2069 N7-methylase RlmK/C1962 C5-methylase RlmI